VSVARQLFGTDGIRGVAGQFPLDPPTVFAFGCALGEWARQHSRQPRVLLGTDTRESAGWLAGHVAGGLQSQGVEVCFAGVLTTPAVAWLARKPEFVAGVVISASHNPFEDNGLKVFDHSGYKLPDEQELKLEQRIFELLNQGVQASSIPLHPSRGWQAEYLDYLISTTPARLEGWRLVLDCANGAATELAPELFRRLGAEVETTGCSPDGRNINLHCGATHIEPLRQQVLASHAHAGVAFDGDADRAILVSSSGRVIDGDAILLIAARELKPKTVVATVMSNLALEIALQAEGIRLLRTPVGDKYVLEEMQRVDAELGGEQSGHIIFRRFATTGDGLLTALQILGIAQQHHVTLDQLAKDFTVYPQKLVNVRVRERRPLEQLPGVQQAIREAQASFGPLGRIVVRYSGTEPLARVMVEGQDSIAVASWADRIAASLRTEIGA
jgi:phosphoglucosamine mutase